MDVVTLGMAKADAQKRYAKPDMRLAALLGDSMTNRNGMGDIRSGVETTLYNDARGWFHWMNLLLGRPLRMVKNAGVGGDTTAQMLARITDITSLNPLPGWVFGMGGVNDQGGLNPTASIANLKAIFEALLSRGINVVWATALPDTGNTGQRWVTHAINDWLRQYAYNRPGFTLVNWSNVFLDPATGNPKTGYTSDGLHQSPLGAAILGQYLAEVVRYKIAPIDATSIVTETQSTVGANTSLSGGTTVATGWNATGWTGYKAPDGHQILVAASGDSTFFQNINLGTWAVGDKLWSEVTFETDDDWTATTKFELSLEFLGDAGVSSLVNRAVDFLLPAGMTSPVNPRRGRLVTPRITAPVGATTAKAILRMNGGGTVHLFNFDTRKVTAAA